MMRLAILLLCALLWSGTAASAGDGARSFFAFPGAAYLEGIGPVYGGAAGARNSFSEETDLLAFKTFGEVRAGGLLARDKRLFDSEISLGAGLGILEEAEIKTSYGREFEERLVVRQRIKGFGIGFRLGLEAIPGRLSLSGAYAFSSIAFAGYSTPDGAEIPFDKSDLHDVNTNVLSLGAAYKVFEVSRSDPGPLELRGKFSALAGRGGQSDIGLFDLGLGGSKELGKGWSLAYTSQASAAAVLRKAGPGSADGKCTTIPDPTLRANCSALESDINRFIARSNGRGTSAPLGGSRGLRSYRELRFKAANTALSGLELRWKPHPAIPLSLAAFVELGHAADELGRLYSQSRGSAGLGARWELAEIPIRAEFAAGQEGSAAFLTLGRPW